MVEMPRRPPFRFWVLALQWAVIGGTGLALVRPSSSGLSDYFSIVWSIYLPICLVGFVGAILHWRHNWSTRHKDPVTELVNEHVIFQVPSLCRLDNLPALERVVLSILRSSAEHLSRSTVQVIIDEGNLDVRMAIFELQEWLTGIQPGEASRVEVLIVPKDYRTPLGSKFKARANQWALERRRSFGQSLSDTWVYHLDDDTGISPQTVASLAATIVASREKDGPLLAQGVLTFPSELAASRWAHMADAVRPADDITRFFAFTSGLGTPLAGLHGEHLLVRADIEDVITWDFPDTVIEDSHFALRFAALYPGRSTFLESCTYGASPATVSDLVRQRRRWSEGMLRLMTKRGLGGWRRLVLAYSVVTWVTAPLQFVGIPIVLSLIVGSGGLNPTSIWLVPIWSFNLAYILWSYEVGYWINESVSEKPKPWYRGFLMIPAIYVISIFESAAVILGVCRFVGLISRQTHSEVIRKPL